MPKPITNEEIVRRARKISKRIHADESYWEMYLYEAIRDDYKEPGDESAPEKKKQKRGKK